MFVVVGRRCGELLEWGFGCWRGSVSVGCWVDFGEVWWSVQLAILKRVELGFCEGNGGVVG